MAAPKPHPPANLVIIGASTGGTRVLPHLVSLLPELRAAIILIQHIPAFITPSFLGTLQRASRMPVSLATDGAALEVGRVLLTPGGFHCVLVDNARLRVFEGAKVNHVSTSVDVTMLSVTGPLTPRLFGVLLTGMGRDGAAGMAHLKRLGAMTFAQNEATCAVHGMPAEAVKLGCVDYELPPEAIAARLVSAITQPSAKLAKVGDLSSSSSESESTAWLRRTPVQA